jgi:ABC-type multidrug transport system fused ATPase/permease subunit
MALLFLQNYPNTSLSYYLATSRELKRLDAVSRSPIFAWFSESLAGLSTIRAFDQQSIFIANNARRIDRNQLCYLPSTAVNRWLAVRLEFVGAIIIVTTAMLAVSAVVNSNVDAGLVGLVLSYALNTTGSLVGSYLFVSEAGLLSSCRIGSYARQVKWNRMWSASNVSSTMRKTSSRKLPMRFLRTSLLLSGLLQAKLNSGKCDAILMKFH